MPFTFKASISVGANRVNIEETRKQRKSCFWWEANRAWYIEGLSMVRGTDRGQVRFLMTKDQAKTSQSCQSMVGWSTEQMLQKTFDPALASDRHFSLTSLLLEIFPQRPEAFSEYPEKGTSSWLRTTRDPERHLETWLRKKNDVWAFQLNELPLGDFLEKVNGGDEASIVRVDLTNHKLGIEKPCSCVF